MSAFTRRGRARVARFAVFLLAVGGCDDVPSGVGGGTSSSSSSSTNSGATMSTGATTSSGATTSTGSGPVYGYCTAPCSTPADCCAPGQPNCPGPSYPNNWTCAMGGCVGPQCTSTADCTALAANYDCFELGEFHGCLIACAGNADCPSPTTCSGLSDDGKKYCTTSTTPCSGDPSCNGFGKCVDGGCGCLSDADCTATGYTHCAL